MNELLPFWSSPNTFEVTLEPIMFMNRLLGSYVVSVVVLKPNPAIPPIVVEVGLATLGLV
jgi:hypothetical protein